MGDEAIKERLIEFYQLMKNGATRQEIIELNLSEVAMIEKIQEAVKIMFKEKFGDDQNKGKLVPDLENIDGRFIIVT